MLIAVCYCRTNDFNFKPLPKINKFYGKKVEFLKDPFIGLPEKILFNVGIAYLYMQNG